MPVLGVGMVPSVVYFTLLFAAWTTANLADIGITRDAGDVSWILCCAPAMGVYVGSLGGVEGAPNCAFAPTSEPRSNHIAMADDGFIAS